MLITVQEGAPEHWRKLLKMIKIVPKNVELVFDHDCAGGSIGEERVIPILRESPTHQQQSRLR
jgi:hypothetical protein